LKTLEYAFYRKIREKAKNMVKNERDANITFKRFHKEALTLINARDLPHDMKYYDDICKKLFEVVEKVDLTEDMISERFNELLEVTKKLLKENKTPTKSDVQHVIDGFKNSTKRIKNYSVDLNTPNPYKIKVPLSNSVQTITTIKEEPEKEREESIEKPIQRTNSNIMTKKVSEKKIDDLYVKKSSVKNDDDPYVKKSSVKNDEFVKKSSVKNDDFVKKSSVKNDDDLYVKKSESNAQKDEEKSKLNQSGRQSNYSKKNDQD